MQRRAVTGLWIGAVLLAGACVGDISGPGLAGEPEHAPEPAVIEPVDAGAPQPQEPSDSGAPAPDAGPARDAGPGPTRLPRAVYPFDRTLSPLTAGVAEHLRAVAARGPSLRDDVFIKVGDSQTVSTAFMACFAAGPVDLAGRTELQPALDHFRSDAGTSTPYDRVSLAAKIGMFASWPLTGAPPPLDREVAALSPRFALVMYGTNDVGFSDADGYGRAMMRLADRLLEQGIIPVFSTIPPRDDDANANARVPLYNAIARAVAQTRQVPLIDLWRELLPLPDHGMWTDKIHLGSLYPSCYFRPAHLNYGQNLRNLRTLETLARLKEVVLERRDRFDTAPSQPEEAGTWDDPVEISSLPFFDGKDTSDAGSGRYLRYQGAPGTGCDGQVELAGGERVYRLRLSSAATIRALVFTQPGVDVDVHLLDDTGAADHCLARGDRELRRWLDPGASPKDYHLVVDSRSDAGTALGGEYLLVVVRE